MVRSLHWFRKALRIHDNASLFAATTGHFFNKQVCNIEYCLPVFVVDPHFVASGTVGTNRMQFLLECLHDLDAQLRAANSRLFVLFGVPQQVIPQLCQQYKIDLLTFERDTEPYAVQRDAQLINSLLQQEQKIKIWTCAAGHTLMDMDKLLEGNSHKPMLQYKSFVKKISSLQISKPLDLPATPFATYPDTLKEQHLVPADLQQLGYTKKDATWQHNNIYFGGETIALKRLQNYLSNAKQVATFSKPETRPTAFNPPDTTVLSPHLKFGTLSCRTFYWELKKVLDAYKGTITQPPTSLLGQLYWREFFYYNAYATPGFGRMSENPHCLQVTWRTVEKDDNAQALLTAWTEGKTGYPYIDACMRQLRQQGYLHHLARHSVACFLTRGDLWLHWEYGARVFDELLLDADYSINMGNWMWLSASCFFHEYFRIYSPVAFPQKTDANGDYVRHFVPELKDLPSKYIYEPWKAPSAVLKQAKCVLGTTYPHRIVIHETASKANKDKMKQAYASKTYGTVPQDKAAKFEQDRQVICKTGTLPVFANTATTTTVVRSRKRKLEEMQNE